MPDPTAYSVVIHEGEEHLYPSGDDAHDATRHCPCEPLRGRFQDGSTVWFHRTQAPPL